MEEIINKIDNVMNKKMSRKSFVTLSLSVLGGLFGLMFIPKIFSNFKSNSNSNGLIRKGNKIYMNGRLVAEVTNG